jgi:hypothetical protein
LGWEEMMYISARLRPLGYCDYVYHLEFLAIATWSRITMKLLDVLTFVGTASAATLRIDVGQGGFVFSPDTITAAAGDVLDFHFVAPSIHAVVAGDLANPCKPAATGGFFSGFLPVSGGVSTRTPITGMTVCADW